MAGQGALFLLDLGAELPESVTGGLYRQGAMR